MNRWQVIFEPIKSLMDQLAVVLSQAPIGVMLVAVLIPLVLAALSRRVLTFLGTALLAVTAPLLLLEPKGAATIVAFSAYIGSVILAISGLAARRREAAVYNRLANMRAELNQFAEAESRRFLVKLKRDERELSKKKSAASEPKE